MGRGEGGEGARGPHPVFPTNDKERRKKKREEKKREREGRMSPRGRIGSRAYRRTYTRRVYAISITASSPPHPPRCRPPQTAFRRARTRNGKDSPFSTTARSNETVRSSEPENTFIMRKSAGIAHRGLLSCPVSRGRGQFSFGDFPRYRSAVRLSNLSSLCLSPHPVPFASTRKSILPRNVLKVLREIKSIPDKWRKEL